MRVFRLYRSVCMCVCSFMINTWSNMKTYKFHFSDVNVCHFYASGIWWVLPSRLYSRRYNNHGWPGITPRKKTQKQQQPILNLSRETMHKGDNLHFSPFDCRSALLLDLVSIVFSLCRDTTFSAYVRACVRAYIVVSLPLSASIV